MYNDAWVPFNEKDIIGFLRNALYGHVSASALAAFRDLINSTESAPVVQQNKRKKKVKVSQVWPLPTETEEEKQMDQASGLRWRDAGRSSKRVKRFSMGKILKSNIFPFEYQLGQFTGTDLAQKHLVSEFDPGTGGCILIPNRSGEAPFDDGTLNKEGMSPMHIFDLNYYAPEFLDTPTAWPAAATNQTTNRNARHWVWSHTNQFIPYLSNSANGPRWWLNDADGYFANYPGSQVHSNKVYRKSIDLRLMLYGCTKVETEFDIRIIRILDPEMCPDYESSLTNTGASFKLQDFQQRWQNLCRAWSINPLLKGVEPGPKPSKKWFETVMKRRVKIGEQTSSIEALPTAMTSLHLDINELNNLQWDENKGFVTEEGDAAYDNVPVADDDVVDQPSLNSNQREKVYYTRRYYLLVRAIATRDARDTGGQDGGSGGIGGSDIAYYAEGAPLAKLNYTPSFDLVARTYWLTQHGT